MTKFKLLFLTPLVFLLLSLNACSSSQKESAKELKICPQCHMELPSSKLHTARLEKDSKSYYFDDIGCMILWAKDDKLPKRSQIFTNDTHKYMQAQKLHYTINEKTPMSYGFGAYEGEKENTITFDEVVMRMLRGEHMANPKIRKQILGY